MPKRARASTSGSRKRARTSSYRSSKAMARYGVRPSGYAGILVGSHRGERKFSESGVSENQVIGTGYVFHASQVPMGAGPNNRVGRQITYTSVEIDFEITVPFDEGVTEGGFVKGYHLALVWDRQPNGAAPTFETIWQNSSSNKCYCFLNDSEKRRFKVLKIWRGNVIGGVNTADPQKAWLTDKSGIRIHKYLDVSRKNLTSTFGDLASGAIADIKTGALYFTVISDSLSPASEPEITWNVRCRFSDY